MPRAARPLVLLPLCLLACGDDGGRLSASDASVGLTPATVPSGDATPTTDASAATGLEGSGTFGETEAFTSTTASTTASSTPTTPTTLTTDLTEGCSCTPGDVSGCDDEGQQLVCGDDCQTYAPTPCPEGQLCAGDACAALLCLPGAIECVDEDSYQTCNAVGDAFDPPVDCPPTEACSFGSCSSLCAIAESAPSTIGCSFFGLRADNFNGNETDSFTIGNTSKTKAASVQFYFTPNGTNAEQPQGAPVVIPPGGTTTFAMDNPSFDKTSGLRVGGSYRAQSDIPVIAYQHSPISAQATNDSSVLFPEHALRQDYVIASYVDGLGGYPSYFNVVARDPDTTVQWTPPQASVGGNGVPDVGAGQTGMVVMNRFDTLQVISNFGGDLSGTIVHADKPIWVLGAVECVNVPVGVAYCDHIQEQMLALDYWGKTYVGAHSPRRGNETHYWRVYGGADGTTVTTDPPQPGTPLLLNRGQWTELAIANNTSFIFNGDKPFLPVQYLAGEEGGAGTGDPAMYQMIPVEQFLDRYAFVTGTGYSQHYAQILRTAGGAPVLVDNQMVDGYYAVGTFEVADWPISEGAHLAESEQAFGILNIGYTGVTSYAYPGGLKLAVINPQ
jgi:hypothetical protein